jgi:hypothetical protein
MRLWHASASMGLFIFIESSFALCLISCLAMPIQMECAYSGTSACSMHGEECGLTESGNARVRTAQRAPAISLGRGLINLTMPVEYP